MRGKDTMLLGPAPAPDLPRARPVPVPAAAPVAASGTRSGCSLLEGKKAVEEKYGRKCKVIVDVDPVNLM